MLLFWQKIFSATCRLKKIFSNIKFLLTRRWKIFAKDRGTTEEPLKLLTGDLTKTPGKVLGILLESHFLGTGVQGSIGDLKDL